MAGMGLALLGTALLIKRLNQRMTAALALSIACIANLWSGSSPDFPLLLALRVLVGAGTGVCYSIAIVSIVASANVARNFGYSVAANQISGILLLTILPALTIWGGLPAAMVTLAIFTLFCGVTLSWLPAHSIVPTGERQGASSSVIRSAPAARGAPRIAVDVPPGCCLRCLLAHRRPNRSCRARYQLGNRYWFRAGRLWGGLSGVSRRRFSGPV